MVMRAWPLISCTLTVLMTIGLLSCRVMPQADVLIIRNGTLIDGTGRAPVADGALILRDGRISAVGPESDIEIPDGARILDAAGGYIVPGFIDAHVHYSQTGWFDGRPDALDLRDEYPYPEVVARLQEDPERFFDAYLCSGVTATFDVGGYPWTRDLESRSESLPHAPRVEAAGALLSTIDFWLNLPDQKQFVYMADEPSVRETVRAHAALGSSAVKVWFVTPPQPPDSTRAAGLVRAAGEEAERFDLPLIVHATGPWEAKEAVRSGADVLVHSVFDGPVDDEFLQLAKENDVVYTTTLTVLEGYMNAFLSKDPTELPYPTACIDAATGEKLREGIPSEKQPAWTRNADPENPPPTDLEIGLQNLRRVHAAGIPIAMGTDAGNPGTLHGPSVYREMELLARGGLSLMEVLTASTRNAARAMGRGDDLGTLEVGKLADVVILEENPLEDVSHFQSVRKVVKGGQIVWPR